MSTRDRIRVVLFWLFMVTLALIWMSMHEMGRGSRANTFIAFGPIVGVLVLFGFIFGLEIGIKHRGKA